MKPISRTLSAAVLSLLAMAAWCEEDSAGSAATAGLKAYVDPDTGEWLEGPSGPPIAAPHDSSASGLREVRSKHPDGGVGIDLEGRFQSPLEATVRPDGKASIRHLPATPEP
jgi:hypothetical protein